MRLEKFLEVVLESGLIGLLLFTALIRVPSPALQAVIVFSTIFFIILYCVRISLSDTLISLKLPFALPLSFFLLFIGFQLLPLSPGLLAAVSPRTLALYEKAYYLLSASPAVKTNISIYNHSTRVELMLLLAYGALFYLVAKSFSRSRSRRRVIFTLILIGCIYSIRGPFVLKKGIWVNSRNPVVSFMQGATWFSPLPYQAHFVEYLEVSFLVTLGFFLQYLRNSRTGASLTEKLVRAGTAVAFSLILLVMFLSPFLSTYARSPLLVFPFSLVVFLLLGRFLPSAGRGRRRITVLLAVMVLFAVAVFIYPLSPVRGLPGPPEIPERLGRLRQKLFSFTFSSSSEEAAPDLPLPLTYNRIDIYRDTLGMIGKFPLFGVGLGNFKYAFPVFKKSYRYVSLHRPHNDYLELLSETGLVGFGLLMMVLVLFFRGIFRQLPYTSWQFVGCVGSLVALLVESLFTFPLEDPSIFVLTVFVAGLVMGELPSEQRCNRRGSFTKRVVFFTLLLPLLLIWGTAVGKSCLARSLYLRAEVLKGQKTKAIQKCLKAVSLDGGNAEYHAFLGRLYWEKASIDPGGGKAWKKEAGRQFQEAVFLNPLAAGLHYRLGDYYEKIGEGNKAKVEFRKSALLSPTNPQFLRRLARAYLASGEEGLAVDLYRKAVLIRPRYLEGVLDELYGGSGDCLALIKVVPPEEEYHLALYRFLVGKGDVFWAEKILEAAREKFPGSSFTRWD